MDVLDMLDALEGRIAAMRGEHERLSSALEAAEQRLRRTKRASGGKRTSRAKQSGPKRKQPAKPKPPAETEEPKLGKRQALGRSLLEIRKGRGV